MLRLSVLEIKLETEDSWMYFFLIDVTEGDAWDIERYGGKGKGSSQMKKKIQ